MEREKPKQNKEVCDICQKSFYSVKRHKLAIHDLLRPYSCKYCKKSFNDTSALARHHELHLAKSKGEKLFQCNLCDFKCSTKPYLGRHMEKHKTDYYDCKECGSRIKGKYKFKDHIKGHKIVLKCSDCDELFKRSDYLRKHKFNKHRPNVERVSCKECDSTFKAKEYLRKHMKYRHSVKDEGRWKCETCNKSFIQQGALIKHKRIHSGERLKCEFCSSTFVDKNNLKTHIQRIHIGETKDKICNVCNKSFGCNSKLSMHQLIHRVKRHTCECGAKFLTLHDMKRHAKRKGCKKDSRIGSASVKEEEEKLMLLV